MQNHCFFVCANATPCKTIAFSLYPMQRIVTPMNVFSVSYATQCKTYAFLLVPMQHTAKPFIVVGSYAKECKTNALLFFFI